MTQESPVFSRIYDLLLWLLRTTRKFPRDQRFVLAKRVLDKAFAVEDALVAASLDRPQALSHLRTADQALTGLRRVLLLCHELELLQDGQFRHAAGLTAEVGRLLGGWQRSLQAKVGPAQE